MKRNIDFVVFLTVMSPDMMIEQGPGIAISWAALMMKAVAKRVAQSAGSALWAGTTGLTDTGGGATDVIVVRYGPGHALEILH